MFKEGTEEEKNFILCGGINYKEFSIATKTWLNQWASMHDLCDIRIRNNFFVYDRSFKIAIGCKNLDTAKKFIDNGWLDYSNNYECPYCIPTQDYLGRDIKMQAIYKYHEVTEGEYIVPIYDYLYK